MEISKNWKELAKAALGKNRQEMDRLLKSAAWQFATDKSGQPIHCTIKGQDLLLVSNNSEGVVDTISFTHADGSKTTAIAILY